MQWVIRDDGRVVEVPVTVQAKGAEAVHDHIRMSQPVSDEQLPGQIAEWAESIRRVRAAQKVKAPTPTTKTEAGDR